MEELRVPTTQVEAELQLDDGRVLRGAIFLPASSSHAGATRPDEWSNEPAHFFPFRLEGCETAELFSKHTTLRLSVPAALLLEEEQPADVEHRQVVVETTAGSFEGLVRLDMPAYQRRILDYLNEPPTFFCVVDGATAHLIHKRMVRRIVETD